MTSDLRTSLVEAIAERLKGWEHDPRNIERQPWHDFYADKVAEIAADVVLERLEEVDRAFVRQERRYLDGVPFGGWIEAGEAYVGDKIDIGDEPLYRWRDIGKGS